MNKKNIGKVAFCTLANATGVVILMNTSSLLSYSGNTVLNSVLFGAAVLGTVAVMIASNVQSLGEITLKQPVEK